MLRIALHGQTRGRPGGGPSGFSRGRVAAIAAAALLSACASRGPPMPPDDFGVPSERRIFAALREARARDEQRQVILAAYDDSEPKLEALAERSEELLERWRELDRRDPAFRERATRLAAEYAEVSGARVGATAAFEARVAETLDADQWEAWQEFWLQPAFGPGMGEPARVMRGGGRRR